MKITCNKKKKAKSECFSEIISKHKLHNFKDDFHRTFLVLHRARIG